MYERVTRKPTRYRSRVPSKNTCRYPFQTSVTFAPGVPTPRWVPACMNRRGEKASEIRSHCRSAVDSEARTRPLISLYAGISIHQRSC